MAHKPEDQMWLWVLKGYVGLHSIVKKWIVAGNPVTPLLIEGLRQARTDIDALITELEGK